MQSLVETALARRWPPSMFARLCNQVQETMEGPEDAATTLIEATATSPPDSLALEFLLAVVVEPRSVLPLETLVKQWTDQPASARTQSTKLAMIYIARGIGLWRFPNDRTLPICHLVDRLVDQALDNVPESQFLLQEMGRQDILKRLGEAQPEWRMAAEERLRRGPAPLHQLFVFGQATVSAPVADAIAYTPSKVFRLLWLDALVSGLQHLGRQVVIDQLNILWPNERTSALIYELTLTAFDGLACAIPSKRAVLWAAFILKRLPLTIQDILAKADPAETNEETADSALARVLTTMDKDMAAAIDSSGDVRTDFIRACIDLGVCDPAVLHAIHKTYTPRPEPPTTILDGTLVITDLPKAIMSQDLDKVNYQQSLLSRLLVESGSWGPLRQHAVAQELLRLVHREPGRAALRPLAHLAMSLVSMPTTCDMVCLHISPVRLVSRLLRHVDSAAAAEVLNSMVYAEVGMIMGFVRFACERYALPTSAFGTTKSWALTFVSQSPGEYYDAAGLSESQNRLLGGWVVGLLGGQGISDQLLRPPCELFPIIPALIVQCTTAYNTRVIDFETLSAGLDYFTQPSFTPLTIPAFRVLCQNLWQQRIVRASLEVIKYLLQTFSRDQRPDYAFVCHLLLPQINWAVSLPINADIPDAGSALQAVKALIAELANRHNISLRRKDPATTGSAAQNLSSAVDALTSWQERSVGIPAINRAAFRASVEILDPEKALEIINKDQGPHATEVQVAFLTVYGSGLFGANSDLILAQRQKDSGQGLSKLVSEFVEKFQAIFRESAVREAAAPTPDEPNPVPDSEPQTKQDTDTMPSLDNEFTYGFDLDTSAMDLDELDTTMDFNMWE